MGKGRKKKVIRPGKTTVACWFAQGMDAGGGAGRIAGLHPFIEKGYDGHGGGPAQAACVM